MLKDRCDKLYTDSNQSTHEWFPIGSSELDLNDFYGYCPDDNQTHRLHLRRIDISESYDDNIICLFDNDQYQLKDFTISDGTEALYAFVGKVESDNNYLWLDLHRPILGKNLITPPSDEEIVSCYRQKSTPPTFNEIKSRVDLSTIKIEKEQE